MLKNKYTIDRDLDISPLIVKKLFLYDKYDFIITQFIPSLPYKTKGLYFNSLNTKHANQLFLFNNNDNRNRVKQDKRPSNKVDISIQNTSYGNGNGNGNGNGYGNSNGNSNGNGNIHGNGNGNGENLKTFRLNKSDKPDIYNIHAKDIGENGTKHLGVACIPNIRSSKLVNKLLVNVSTFKFVNLSQ